MNLSEARAVLDLAAISPTPGAVRAAFAAKVRQLHPDTSDGPQEGASMATLQAARDLLLQAVGGGGGACPYCQGRGFVVKGFARVPCPKRCPPT